MSRQHRSLRVASVSLLGSLLLGVVAAPASVASSDLRSCRVRNVTQDTAGTSFAAMVAAAVDGDRLLVRGTCLAVKVVIRADITVVGVGEHRAVLDARRKGKVLQVDPGAVVAIRHLVIVRGRSPVRPGWWGRGGGILNRSDATQTITDAVIRGNRAGYGGGIFNRGSLTIADSVVRGNKATATSDGAGGGIGNGWTLTLTDSVVRGNTASDHGGGIGNAGTLVLEGSTVTGNTAGTHGGGIWNFAGPWYPGTVLLDAASSVTGNTPDDCVGTPAC